MSPNVPSPSLHHQQQDSSFRTKDGTPCTNYSLTTRFNSPLNTPIPHHTFHNDHAMQVSDSEMHLDDLNEKLISRHEDFERSSLQTPHPPSPSPKYSRISIDEMAPSRDRRSSTPDAGPTPDSFSPIVSASLQFVNQEDGSLPPRTFFRSSHHSQQAQRSFTRSRSQQELDHLTQQDTQQQPFAVPKALARRRSHSGSGPYSSSKSPLTSSSPGAVSQQANIPYSPQEQARDLKSSSIEHLLKSEPYLFASSGQPVFHQTSIAPKYQNVSYHGVPMSNTLLTTSAISLPTILSPVSHPSLVSLAPLTASIPALPNPTNVPNLYPINYTKPSMVKMEKSEIHLKSTGSRGNPSPVSPTLITTNFSRQYNSSELKGSGNINSGSSFSTLNVNDLANSRTLMSGKKPPISTQSMFLPNVTLSPVTPSSIKTIQTGNQESKLFLCSGASSSSSSLNVKDSPPHRDDSPSFAGDCLSPQSRPFRARSDSDRVQYKEHRRVCHINAEQKRRYNIKNNFEMLHSLVPSVSQNPNAKVSKATMLLKGAEYIQQLQEERQSITDKAENLRKQIETLSNDISTAQSLLPATGAPLARSRHNCVMREHYKSYVRERSLENWKFYLLSLIGEPLMDSFNEHVSTSSVEDLSRTTMAWLDQHSSLNVLRPVVSNAMRRLSTSTCILTQPERLSEDVFCQVTKHEGRHQQQQKTANNVVISNSFNAR